MRNRRYEGCSFAAAVLCGILALAGCSSGTKTPERAAEQPKKAEKAPEKFYTNFETTKGDFVIETVREWAPRGADRFHELVTTGFYDGARFFRVRPKFIVQFGLNKDPKLNELWSQLQIPDDPVKQSNKQGYVTFATRGPSTRTTQIFVNLGNNTNLDSRGFAPFGRVVEGLENIEKLYAGYGEVQALGGGGPDAMKLQTLGDEYAQRSYPRLDQIESAKVIEYTPKAK